MARGWGAAFSGYLLHFEAGDLHRLPASDTRRTGPRDDPRNVKLYAKSSEPPTPSLRRNPLDAPLGPLRST